MAKMINTLPQQTLATIRKEQKFRGQITHFFTRVTLLFLITRNVNPFTPTYISSSTQRLHDNLQNFRKCGVLFARRNNRHFESLLKLRHRLNSTIRDDDLSIYNGRRYESRFQIRRRLKSALRTMTSDDTWSGSSSGNGGRRSAVKNRVRRVLEKARGRTGIENGSTLPSSSVTTTTPPRDLSTAVKNGSSLQSSSVTTTMPPRDPPTAVKNGSSLSTSSMASTMPPRDPPTAVKNGSSLPSSPVSTTTPIDLPAAAIVEAASIGGLGGVVDGDTPPSPFDYVPLNDTVATTTRNGRIAACDEIDAFRSDVSAAFAIPASPLPFTIPDLSASQYARLRRGERVEFQQEMGLEGNGYVVIDVKAPAKVVWECLLDFHSYPDLIPTVRDVTMYTNTHLNEDYYHEDKVEYEDGRYAILKHGIPSVTRAAFTLSKFKLKIAAIHKYRPHPQGDYMIFTLDQANKNMILQNAKGIWHTQSNPDGKGEDYTRVWLLCELRVSRMLPKFIVDYAAKKAMPRATTWLKPQVETAASLWLKE